MLRITKTPGDDYGCRQNPESALGIYMTLVMEAQCCIVTKNWRKQDEVKQNTVQFNAVENAVRVTNQGGYLEKILSALENYQSGTGTTEESTDSVFQGILALYTETHKDNFFQLGVNISELTDLNKCKVKVDIFWRWVKCIIEEVVMVFS